MQEHEKLLFPILSHQFIFDKLTQGSNENTGLRTLFSNLHPLSFRNSSISTQPSAPQITPQIAMMILSRNR
jgi:hypothetical protein